MKLRAKDIRKAKGWTQEHVAELMGTTKGFVSQLETGKRLPSMATLSALAHALGVQVPELIDAGDLTDDLEQLLDIMKDLTPDDRRSVIRAATGFLPQQRQ